MNYQGLRQKVRDFNRTYPVGTPVIVTVGLGSIENRRRVRTVTRSQATLIGFRVPAVKLRGIAGMFGLSRITPIGPSVDMAGVVDLQELLAHAS